MKTKIKNKGACRLCRADFEVWLSNMGFDPEKEERMEKSFSHFCTVCKCALVCRTSFSQAT